MMARVSKTEAQVFIQSSEIMLEYRPNAQKIMASESSKIIAFCRNLK